MTGTKYVGCSQQKEIRRFKWPNYVIYEGREIKCCNKFPNHAVYMLPPAFMNKKLILSKEQWLRHLDKHGYSD